MHGRLTIPAFLADMHGASNLRRAVAASPSRSINPLPSRGGGGSRAGACKIASSEIRFPPECLAARLASSTQFSSNTVIRHRPALQQSRAAGAPRGGEGLWPDDRLCAQCGLGPVSLELDPLDPFAMLRWDGQLLNNRPWVIVGERLPIGSCLAFLIWGT